MADVAASGAGSAALAAPGSAKASQAASSSGANRKLAEQMAKVRNSETTPLLCNDLKAPLARAHMCTSLFSDARVSLPSSCSLFVDLGVL
jgi:hypothetical protein